MSPFEERVRLVLDAAYRFGVLNEHGQRPDDFGTTDTELAILNGLLAMLLVLEHPRDTQPAVLE